MNLLDVLPLIDWFSLLVLALILLVLLLNRLLHLPATVAPAMGERLPAGARLTGGVPLALDVSLIAAAPTSTNDPFLMAHAPGSAYLGPDQTALAITLLDQTEVFEAISGFIPADLITYLDGPWPKQIGSSDPAATPHLFVCDPTALLAEETLSESRHPTFPILRLLAILLLLLPLIYRLLAS